MLWACTTLFFPLHTSRYEAAFLLVAVFFIVRRVCLESSRSSSPTPELNLFLSGGALYTCMYIFFFCFLFFVWARWADISPACDPTWLSVTTTGSGFALTVLNSLCSTWSLRFGSLRFGAVRRSTVVAGFEYAGNYRSLEYWLSFCRASFNPNCNYPAF